MRQVIGRKDGVCLGGLEEDYCFPVTTESFLSFWWLFASALQGSLPGPAVADRGRAPEARQGEPLSERCTGVQRHPAPNFCGPLAVACIHDQKILCCRLSVLLHLSEELLQQCVSASLIDRPTCPALPCPAMPCCAGPSVWWVPAEWHRCSPGSQAVPRTGRTQALPGRYVHASASAV